MNPEARHKMLQEATLPWVWIIMVKISYFLQPSMASNLQIECLADLYRASGRNWRGYSLEDLSLTGVGTMDLTIAFPSDWKPQACCQKIQLRFSSENLQRLNPPDQGRRGNEENYFLPIAEWTLCSPDLRLLNCYGFGFISKDTSGTVPTVEAPPDNRLPSWSIILQHCFVPGNKTVGYELSTFGEHLATAATGGAEVKASRYSGTTAVTKQDSLEALNLGSAQHTSPPCLIEGSLDTDNQWFSNIIAISVPEESSISYRFLFYETEPSNAALFDVLFYSDADLDRLPKTDKCDNQNEMLDSHWSQTGEESHKILPLSIGNVWSGCSVENINGTPTYTCEGGRNFAGSHTVHIAISNCKKPSEFTLYYFIEVSNSQHECPVIPDPDSDSGRASHDISKHQCYCWFLVALLMYISNQQS